jgi:acyl carrier protein
MSADTEHALRDILRDELDIDPTRVHPGATLLGDLGFDSVEFAIGLVAVEEKLGVRLTAEKLQTCETVDDLANLIDRARQQQHNPVGS